MAAVAARIANTQARLNKLSRLSKLSSRQRKGVPSIADGEAREPRDHTYTYAIQEVPHHRQMLEPKYTAHGGSIDVFFFRNSEAYQAFLQVRLMFFFPQLRGAPYLYLYLYLYLQLCHSESRGTRA